MPPWIRRDEFEGAFQALGDLVQRLIDGEGVEVQELVKIRQLLSVGAKATHIEIDWGSPVTIKPQAKKLTVNWAKPK